MENTLKQRSPTIEREPTKAQVQIGWNNVEHRFKHHIQRFSENKPPKQTSTQSLDCEQKTRTNANWIANKFKPTGDTPSSSVQAIAPTRLRTAASYMPWPTDRVQGRQKEGGLRFVHERKSGSPSRRDGYRRRAKDWKEMSSYSPVLELHLAVGVP